MVAEKIIEIKQLSRSYQDSYRSLTVLDNVDFSLFRGEMVGLIAPSGTGKSTLLHLLGLLEKPNSGDMLIFGRSAASLTDDELTIIRRDLIGFVYQFHYLLPEFTALENIILPQLIAGKANIVAKERAIKILDYMGLAQRMDHYPSQLSGGEQQRVAIGRAVANMPLLLLADEPTGNLDPETSNHVFKVLYNFVKQSGMSAIVATHNYELAAKMDRLITLKNGKILEISLNS
ncbi:ABC transporter ATP-binding protein [Bartonella sp. DGB1]|uniref:ABC transporter ATP-binding protein n=1 Tax=Bartonella sp. DGB1 TaxID=3239807 RepID=UPI003525F44F